MIFMLNDGGNQMRKAQATLLVVAVGLGLPLSMNAKYQKKSKN
jgi:hypothetical protein